MEKLDVYTDGSFRRPSYGAWAAIFVKDDKIIDQIAAPVFNTTNNRMEIQAIKEALNRLEEPTEVTVYTDSQYARDCVTRWVYGWIRNDWITMTGQPVKNRDLVESTHNAMRRHKVKILWVRGHNGDKYNELCDDLCQGITARMVEGQITEENMKEHIVA